MKNKKDLFDNLDIDDLNKKLKKKLIILPHDEEIEGVTWYVDPSREIRKMVIDKNDNLLIEVGD